jgi:hypothetical protein
MFQQITDLVLRRIYKFLLKRTIGKYLQGELLIEQLVVESREGVVTLHDIRLNIDYSQLLPSSSLHIISTYSHRLHIRILTH